MHLFGCDFHTRFQQIAMVDSVTGEILNRRLDHGTGEAHQFYAALQAPARIGMEATGRTNWFEQMLDEPGYCRSRTITATTRCAASKAWPWQQPPSRNRQETRPSSGLGVGVASESRRPKTV